MPACPYPYRIEVGGTVEESANSQASVIAVVPLMLLLMITFLMIQLQSFSMLALCLIVVPMAMTGVVVALLLFQQPLGFVAILGILSLIGMIARNAVILVEQIEAERALGKGAVGGGDRRRRVALPADHADRDLDRAGPDPDRGDDLLGADGFRRHGRIPGRHDRDADIPAGAVRRVVPHQGAADRRRRHRPAAGALSHERAVAAAAGGRVPGAVAGAGGASPDDLPAAAVAVVAATWVSLRLSPPSGPAGFAAGVWRWLVLRFPGQSLMAGIDVARRAFDPRLPLDVDTVAYTPRLPPGPARDAFTAYASLMPGTVPVTAETEGDILIHCLDARQPVAQQMADEEDRFIRVLGYPDD